jgi:GH15 family glucan-1,4-alpha-glucosidase
MSLLARSLPARRIEDYALIGNCGTAALVGRDGSIDWLCLPRFDGAACFASLLGDDDNGRWLLCPTGKVVHSSRRYRDGTLILETDYETEEGAVRVVDLMPVEAAMRVVRQVIGLRGTVTMKTELVIRFDYGQRLPWVRKVDSALSATAGPDTLRLVTPVDLRGEGLKTVAEFTVKEGETVPFVLSWHRSHYAPEPEIEADLAIATTERFWTEWIGRCTFHGPHAAEVRRSLIVLKALTHARTGGMVAAVTTSLPELLGGSRNWDYRYCWLRDASFTTRAFLFAGYTQEASDFSSWVVRVAGGDAHQLQIMYGVAGESRLAESEVTGLRGFADSLPVRIGNAAHQQLQLDVYGELMAVIHECYVAGLDSRGDEWSVIRELLGCLEQIWQKPDSGIWEVRGEPRHFVFSKIMAWVAFDRGVRIAEEHGFEAPLERWRAGRDVIAAEVWERGFDTDKNSLVQSYGSKDLDASVLLAPLLGFCDGKDPRMVGTVAAIEKELMTGGFVRRYLPREELDGQVAQEGVFLPCTFWLVGNLNRQGRRAEADAMMSRLMTTANDLGLFSEEWDPQRGTMLGNFPQAFTHLAMIICALHFPQDTPPPPPPQN